MRIPDTIPERSLFRAKDVAALLEVKAKTVYGWIDQGPLRGRKLTTRTMRISRRDLLKFLKEKIA